MTHRVEITAAQLSSWRATGHPYKVIAAEIATWAADQERGTVLPVNHVFGRNLGIEASGSTFTRAKRLLVTHGVLSTNDGPYQVALRPYGQ